MMDKIFVYCNLRSFNYQFVHIMLLTDVTILKNVQ